MRAPAQVGLQRDKDLTLSFIVVAWSPASYTAMLFWYKVQVTFLRVTGGFSMLGLANSPNKKINRKSPVVSLILPKLKCVLR